MKGLLVADFFSSGSTKGAPCPVFFLSVYSIVDKPFKRCFQPETAPDVVNISREIPYDRFLETVCRDPAEYISEFIMGGGPFFVRIKLP